MGPEFGSSLEYQEKDIGLERIGKVMGPLFVGWRTAMADVSGDDLLGGLVAQKESGSKDTGFKIC